MLGAFLVLPARAATLGDSKLQFSSLKEIRADDWNIVGKNIVVRGNVYIPFGDIEIFADRAVLNVENKDIEASGNIQFMRWQSAGGNVTPERLAELQSKANLRVEVLGIVGDGWGDQSISVRGSALTDNLRAQRLVGNLDTGYFQFDKVQMKFQTFVCRADFGERKPDGVIKVKNAEVSSCEYLEQDNAHYSISCGEATLTPHRTEFYGLENLDTDIGDHSIFITNGFWKVYGVPLLWLPVFYKPKDESPGLFSIQWGENDDWGYYVLMSKRFDFLDYPSISMRVMTDVYNHRGIGTGVRGDVTMQDSSTDFFAYVIRDGNRYRSDDYEDYRIHIPMARFDFKLSNVTHITPRLDFRGNIEYQSDPYFVRDFFEARYNQDPQPSTYAALEQQFDHFSASFYIRPKINSFYTTVERLPSFRIDVPRQELFGSNIYYQGDFSVDYMKMNWIDFYYDSKRGPDIEPLRNYESFRMDTTHFLYYPLNLFNWLTVVPRAGLKLTAYSKTSEDKVTVPELLGMFEAADPENTGRINVKNYDSRGGSKLRFVGELGVEASTKIYNTWQDIRSGWLRLDGLRHVMRPYVNYTYIPKPSVSRDHLYYFDSIDRIEEENFIRFGLENRLQTRNGSTIRDYLNMENYFDLYMEDQDGYNNIGEFCTLLTASPIKGLTLSTKFAIDMGGNNEKSPQVLRNGREAGHPGLNIKWLNRWNLSLSYEPIDDFLFKFSYTYNRPYGSRSAYSMGSTLTQFDAGSFFDKYFDDQSQELTFSMRVPLTPDRRTFGSYMIGYDINYGAITEHYFMVQRQFHCFEVSAGLMFERDYDDGRMDSNFVFNIYLTGLSGPLQQGQNAVLSDANERFQRQGFGF